jgi:hypothetical protein
MEVPAVQIIGGEYFCLDSSMSESENSGDTSASTAVVVAGGTDGANCADWAAGAGGSVVTFSKELRMLLIEWYRFLVSELYWWWWWWF